MRRVQDDPRSGARPSSVVPACYIRRSMPSSALQRLARTTAWLLIEKVVKLLAALVTTVWVARFLGPDLYGELAFVLAFALIFSHLTALGLNALLVEQFVSEDDVGEVMGTALAMRASAALLSGAAAIFLVQAIRPATPVVTLMVAFLAASFLFRTGEVLEHYFLSKQMARPPAVARMLASVFFVAATLGLVIIESSVVWFAVAKASEFLVMNAGFLVMFLRRSSRFRLRVSVSRAASLLATSWPLILSGLGAILNLKIDQVMLSSLSTSSETGLYAAAAQLSEASYFVPTAIMTAVFPTLIRLRKDDAAAYRSRFQQAFDAMVWLGIAFAGVVSLAAGLVIPLLYGEAYTPAAPILVLHVWGGVFVFARAPLSKWIIAEKITRASLVTHGTGAAVNIGANLVLIPAFGGIGAAMATVASYAASSFFALFLWRRTWPAARMMSASLLAPLRLYAHFMDVRLARKN